MTGRKSPVASMPPDELPLLTLDALLRYQALGLRACGDTLYAEILDLTCARLDDSAE
jgi:hypothetical protein